MSTDGEDNNQPARPRRASFAELFASRPVIDSSSANTDVSRPHTGSMAAVTQQAQQQSRTRRLSITTLGLSGSPTNNQPAVPFGSLKRGSVSTATGRRGSIDMTNENAVDDEEPGPLMSAGPVPGRRLSFGAKAYRDLRTSGASGAITETSPPANAAAKITSPSGPSKGVGMLIGNSCILHESKTVKANNTYRWLQLVR